MKILVNLSNLKVGGGIAKGKAFLEFLNYNSDIFSQIIITQNQKKIFNLDQYNNLSFAFLDHDVANILHRYAMIKQLNKIESLFKPEVVFTLFGPSYWRPKTLHLMGFAVSHYVFPESPYFSRLHITERIIQHLRKTIKLHYFRNDADFWYSESNLISERLSTFLKVERNKIHTVHPSNHQIFKGHDKQKLGTRQFTILTISAYYYHKNFEIFPAVIDELRKLNINNSIRFLTTIDDDHYSKLTKNQYPEWINIGPINIEDCPKLYQEANLMFLPTLLECFSASYTEAMEMEVPIITSDLPFATYCCSNAAIYVNPLSATDIAQRIFNILKHDDISKELIINGKKRLKELGQTRPEENYIKILREIIKNK